MINVIMQNNNDNVDYHTGNIIFHFTSNVDDFSMKLFLVQHLAKYMGAGLNCNSIKTNLLEAPPQQDVGRMFLHVWDEIMELPCLVFLFTGLHS